MSIRSLLKKEGHWSRRNVLVLVFLLLVLPTFFATTSAMFQDVVPREVPVAVVPEDEEVTDDELRIVEGGIGVFTDPQIVESEEDAVEALQREQVYGIVTVPPDITDPEAEAEFRLTVDGSIVPFQEPSQVIVGLMEFQLDDVLAADISAERTVIGEEKDLQEYLFPSFLMVVIIFFAFTYVPYNLKREETVLDRLKVESSLEAVVMAKLLYYTVLMLGPILIFHVAAIYYGHTIDSLAPGAIVAFLLTFVLLSTVSMTIMVLTRFSSVGQFTNVVLMLGTIGLSALAFPVGFFSSIRTTIARLLPPHYSMIIARSTMLKEMQLSAFTDWVLGFLALIALGLLALKLSIVYHRRTA